MNFTRKYRYASLYLLLLSVPPGCGTEGRAVAQDGLLADNSVAVSSELTDANVLALAAGRPEPAAKSSSKPVKSGSEPLVTVGNSTILATNPTMLEKTTIRGLQSSNVNLCEGMVDHNERVLIPAVAKPPFMKYYRDPAFGSKVIRITNSRPSEVQKPAYSTMQAWNADESLLLLYRSNGDDAHHILLDGHTYEEVRSLNILPTDLEEIYWSHTDPDTFFYVSKRSADYGKLNRYNVKTNKKTEIKDFSRYCGSNGLPVGGNDVHMQSLDDDLFGFRCQKSQSEYTMLTYRISTDEVTTAPIGKKTPWMPWTAPMPGPSGERLWFQGATLSTDLKTVERRMDMAKSSEHSSVGQTSDGQDALYQVVYDPSPDGCDGDLWQGVGHLVEHNLETGACRPIINEAKGYPYTTSSTHVSAQAYKRPGWVAMSSIGLKEEFDYFSNRRAAPALLSEIYLVNTDPKNEVVCRLAHHRSFAKLAENGAYHSYFGEPHATISPSGTRIVFGSDWYDSGSVDSYVIELPAYKRL